MSEEDKELEMLKAKRLAEMQKNFSEQDQLNDDTNNETEKPKPTLPVSYTHLTLPTILLV